MPSSVWSPVVQSAITEATSPSQRRVRVGRRQVSIPTLFPSPADWRDHWIYFLLIDRLNNPAAPPRHLPFDGEHGVFQGGTFAGVTAQLDYLRGLGVGAIWLSPVAKNCPFEDATYHGYGFQDFLAIEPRFASDPKAARRDPELAERELRERVDAAHARSLYVIFDVVLNHAGNVLAYDGFGATAPFREAPYAIRWRDAGGRPAFADFTTTPDPVPGDAAVWPVELRRNALFRRQGEGGEEAGDFASLKELVTAFREARPVGSTFRVRETLIRAYHYLIAKFDVDGFRIDTPKFIEPEFARLFGNAVREFALSIGKRNFLTLGEVFDEEEKIARVHRAPGGPAGRARRGRRRPGFPAVLPAARRGDGVHVPSGNRAGLPAAERRAAEPPDAARRGLESLRDVPRQPRHARADLLPGRCGPRSLRRPAGSRPRLAPHSPGNPLSLLRNGTGARRPRQQRPGGAGSALGAARRFDTAHRFYQAVRRLATVRREQPALRYGRHYFRPLSGNGTDFGLSALPAGVLAFSRILNDQEVVVVANTSTGQGFSGEVIVDAALNSDGASYAILFSNKRLPTRRARRACGPAEASPSTSQTAA